MAAIAIRHLGMQWLSLATFPSLWSGVGSPQRANQPVLETQTTTIAPHRLTQLSFSGRTSSQLPTSTSHVYTTPASSGILWHRSCTHASFASGSELLVSGKPYSVHLPPMIRDWKTFNVLTAGEMAQRLRVCTALTKRIRVWFPEPTSDSS